MPDYATKKDVQDIVTTAVTKAVDDLSEIISQLAQNMHGELVGIKGDIVGIKGDIVGIKGDIKVLQNDVTELKESHNRLMNTLDAFLKRLDDIETDNTARDAQLARLERWIEQIASKTGVKLEY